LRPEDIDSSGPIGRPDEYDIKRTQLPGMVYALIFIRFLTTADLDGERGDRAFPSGGTRNSAGLKKLTKLLINVILPMDGIF